jgi:hypothetical protein
MQQYSNWYMTTRLNPKLAADDWPLLESGMISRTYQGDLDSSFAIDRVVRRVTERAPDGRFDTGVVTVHARLWQNHFHEQWIPGQPMFSIECFDDKTHDSPAVPQAETRKRKKEDKPSLMPSALGIATLVSLPQLNALLYTASHKLFDLANPPPQPMPSSRPPSAPKRGTPSPVDESPPSVVPSGKVKMVKAPSAARITVSDIIKTKSEEEWYDDKTWWKAVVAGRREITYANIKYLRNHVRYVGILDREPEDGVEEGTVVVRLGCTGDVRCHDYWGDKAMEGESVGFTIKRDAAAPLFSYVVAPWKSIDDVSKQSELEFNDLAKRKHIGLFFHVGKIVSVNLIDRARGNPLRLAPIEKLVENPYLGLYGNTVDPSRAHAFTVNAPRCALVSLGMNVKNAYASLRRNFL